MDNKSFKLTQCSVFTKLDGDKSSEFGLMKFPPQDYYGIGPNQSTEYIRDNIYNQIMGSGGLFGIEGSYDDSDITLAQQMRADWIHFAKKGFLPDANAFNHEESMARIYDQVISDQIIEHRSFYESYSSYWENLQ